MKGGWSWKGETLAAGQIIDAPSAEWIANRVADDGLVEPVTEEEATAPAPEAAEPKSSEPAPARPRGRK